MKELSLHILDIVENSVRANAHLIEIEIDELKIANMLRISIRDDGMGMDDQTVQRVLDPFFTTKTVRRIGIGLSLLDLAARRAGGKLAIASTPGIGTQVSVDFIYDHVDRQPLGDLASTMTVLISGNPSIDFVLNHRIDDSLFTLDTRILRDELGDIDLNEPDVLNFISGLIRERRNITSEDS